MPCMARVYVLESKGDTSLNPITYFTSGLADQGNPSINNPMLYLSDSEMLKSNYKTIKCIKKLLPAGGQFTVSHGIKNIIYDTSQTDTHGSTFQRKYKSYAFCIRIEGVVSHQANASGDVGTSDGKLCILKDTVAHIEYDSGSSGTKQIIVVNNSATQSDPVVAQSTKRIQNSSAIEGY